MALVLTVDLELKILGAWMVHKQIPGYTWLQDVDSPEIDGKNLVLINFDPSQNMVII